MYAGLNVFLACVPAAWALNIVDLGKPKEEVDDSRHIVVWTRECIYSKFTDAYNPIIWPTVAFLGLIALEQIFDWGGEQMAHYLGMQLGDLLIVTLNK